MNQRRSLPPLRSLLKVETVLLGLVIIVGLIGYTRIEPAEQDVLGVGDTSGLEAELRLASDDLDYLRANDERPKLREELAALKAAPLALPVPERHTVAQLGDSIVFFAAEQGLELLFFSSAEGPVTRGTQEFQSIKYSIVASGEVNSLIGVLAKLDDIPTTAVDLLEFSLVVEEETGEEPPAVEGQEAEQAQEEEASGLPTREATSNLEPGAPSLWQMNLDLTAAYATPEVPKQDEIVNLEGSESSADSVPERRWLARLESVAAHGD